MVHCAADRTSGASPFGDTSRVHAVRGHSVALQARYYEQDEL